MLLPMAILAAACFIIGLVPAILAPVLDHAMAAWSPDMLAPRPPLATLPMPSLVAPIGTTLKCATVQIALCRLTCTFRAVHSIR
jgi:hydrogenase-4 component B